MPALRRVYTGRSSRPRSPPAWAAPAAGVGGSLSLSIACRRACLTTACPPPAFPPPPPLPPLPRVVPAACESCAASRVSSGRVPNILTPPFHPPDPPPPIPPTHPHPPLPTPHPPFPLSSPRTSRRPRAPWWARFRPLQQLTLFTKYVSVTPQEPTR